MPTKDQLILYYYNRYVVKNKKSTLPYLTEPWAEKLIVEYSKVMAENKITVVKALKILDDSMSSVKRR